jgi:hypothetical protein
MSTNTPLVEELASPARTGALPEPLEIFPHEVAADALEVVLQEFGQLHGLRLGAVLGAFQQTPAGMLQHLLVPITLQLGRFATADLVDRLVYLLHDVEAIQDVDGVCQLTKTTPASRANFITGRLA